jgi:uncharacterized BrkB/YihY/UPF0761 family membrane protein
MFWVELVATLSATLVHGVTSQKTVSDSALFVQIGGYILPFAVMGTFLMLVAILIYFILPPLGNERGQLRPEGKFLWK